MRGVEPSAELRRVLAIPRRRADGADLIDPLTELLGVFDTCQGWRTPTPEGFCSVCEGQVPVRLRATQALALHDIGVHRGAFCPIGCGEGKTLVTLLAPYVLDSKRPLLLLPANLIEKTKRDRRRLAVHWRIPTNIRLLSYQMLGRVQSAGELAVYAPDLFMGDEAHNLKNPNAAVTRRVFRALAAFPDTPCVWLSGTMMNRSLCDFGHLAGTALKGNAPVPLDRDELDQWALALDPDDQVDAIRRNEPGALLDLCTPEDADPIPVVAARRGFQRRLVETPGVIATTNDGEHIGASLVIRALTYKMSSTTEQHFDALRTENVTPDGWDIEPIQVWQHARELALGFHGMWVPRPPDPWRAARRAWFAFVRSVLSRSETLDSPEHVEMAVDAGLLPGDVLATWRAVKDTYPHDEVPVWHDDSALEVAIEWMSKGPGIVWTSHVPFATRLAEMSGAPYFGEGGFDAAGNFIDDAPNGRAIIASIDANREGRNLQGKWSRNLVTTWPDSAARAQQMICRTHRPGQRADVVTFDVFLGCTEHARAMAKSRAAAEAVRDTTGAPAKLLIATIDWPTDAELLAAPFTGARWGRSDDRRPAFDYRSMGPTSPTSRNHRYEDDEDENE